MIVYLDTHLVLWLYAGRADLISEKASKAIDENDLYLSPIVELELQFLKDIKKIRENPPRIINTLQKNIGLKICGKDFYAIVKEASRFHWTRDPFDRILVAQASLNDNPLLTKDGDIKAHYHHVIW